ncbi:hypothetical protein ACPENL_003137 [Yersinia enterocolitica]|nr:hypothetical protein [Yersinia enterocolitica]HDL6901001.1 hypothetical protein [Yersinia enterocolitica]HDL7092107.1 hypothetical protein [Yersinia enterocolitica]HDL7101145.1 hypothetical protein [Yersinia enterocolitica]HDL7135627.1 hypothetical protein [Yersinia enterocolitica]
MSYERQTSMTRLEQYRAHQKARMEAMNRAIDEGRSTVVLSNEVPEPIKKVILPASKSTQPEDDVAIFGRSARTSDLFNTRAGLGFIGKRRRHSSIANTIHKIIKLQRSIANGLSDAAPEHGEIFVYNAKTNQIERLNQKISMHKVVKS